MKGLSLLICMALFVLAHQLSRHPKKPRMIPARAQAEPALTFSNAAAGNRTVRPPRARL